MPVFQFPVSCVACAKFLFFVSLKLCYNKMSCRRKTKKNTSISTLSRSDKQQISALTIKPRCSEMPGRYARSPWRDRPTPIADWCNDNLSYIMSVDWGHSSEHCSDSGDGITVKSYYTNTVTALRTYRFLPVHVYAVVGLFAMHIVICQWLCCLVPDWWLSVIVQLYIVSVNLPTCDRGLK